MKTFLAVFFISVIAYFFYCTGLVKGQQQEPVLQTRVIVDVDRAPYLDLNAKKIILIRNILALQQSLVDLESENGLQLDR